MHTYFWSLSNCNLRRQMYVGKMFSFFLVLRIKSTNRSQLRYIDNENIISISSGVKYIQYHPWYKSTSNCQYPGRKSLKGINSLIVGRHMKSHKWILTYSKIRLLLLKIETSNDNFSQMDALGRPNQIGLSLLGQIQLKNVDTLDGGGWTWKIQKTPFFTSKIVKISVFNGHLWYNFIFFWIQ